MAVFKIEWVGDTPNEWGEGPNKTYYYQVAGTYEGQKKTTSIGVKDTAKAPKAGDEIEGYFYTDDKGKEKFKKEAKGGFGAKQGSTYSPKDPADRASIEKQVSLKCANEMACALIGAGKEIKSTDVITIAHAYFEFLHNDVMPKKAAPKPVEADEDIQEHPADEPQDEPKWNKWANEKAAKGEDIDLSELPFGDEA